MLSNGSANPQGVIPLNVDSQAPATPNPQNYYLPIAGTSEKSIQASFASMLTALAVAAIGGLFPSGGNDGAAITAALVAASAPAGGLGIVRLNPGTYNLATPIDFTSAPNVILMGAPGVTLKGSMAATGGVANSVIKGAAVLSGVGNTTCNGTPTPGSDLLTVASAAGITQNSIVQVASAASANLVAYYRVLAITGNILLLDQPLTIPFANGDTVKPCTSIPFRFFVLGGGMLITGTGDRAFDVQAARECYVENVSSDTSGGSLTGGFVWDLGSTDCDFKNVRVNGLTAAALEVYDLGVAFQSAIRCRANGCRAEHCTTAGLAMFDAYVSRMSQCDGYDCGGLGATAGSFGTHAAASAAGGTTDSFIEGCSFNNSNIGLALGLSTRVTFEKTTIFQSGATACTVGVGGTAATDAVFDKLEIVAGQGVGTVGLIVDGACFRPRFENLITNAIPVTPIDWRAPVGWINGWKHVGSASTASCLIIRSSTTKLRVEDADISLVAGTGGASAVFVVGGGSTVLFFKKMRVRFGAANDTIFNVTAAGTVVELQDIEAEGVFAGTLGFTGAAGTVLRRLGRVDFSNVATPYTVSESDQGTAIANGATAVDIPFRDLRAGAVVLFSVLTPGGATARTPQYTLVAASKAQLTSVAGDTTTYGFKILD